MDHELQVFRFTFEEEVTMLARLIVAGVAGAVIGLERQASGKKAGIRTVMMVSLGSALFTVVSIFGFDRADTARVAAQVASGIGFLGAGAIIRHGGSVRGLTTASAIWVAAALGVAAGAGLYVLAIGGAVLASVVLEFLPREPSDDLDEEDRGGGNSVLGRIRGSDEE
jgi:putative Mg2+ transporter-C (MgtC) family protein